MRGADLVRAIRHDHADPRELVVRLGLADRRVSQRAGSHVLIRCPAHDERSPSCSLRVGGDGTIAVHCFGCGFTGDALTLVAAVHRLDVRRDFRDVVRLGAELAGRWDIAAELDRTPTPPPSRTPRPEPAPLPRAEVLPLIAAGRPTADDDDARAMLEARALDPGRVDDLGLSPTSSRGLRGSATRTSTPRW